MSFTLTLATAATRTLVVESLRSAADQRTRVARRAAAATMAEKADGKDPRSSAVKVTALLAEAETLAGLADELAAAEEVVIVGPVPPLAVPDPAPAVTLTDGCVAEHDPARPECDHAPEDVQARLTLVVDDGTSPEAQRAAARAGLEGASPDGTPLVEDPVTAELPEDRPTPDQIEDVLT